MQVYRSSDKILTIQANFEVESDVKKTADQTIQKFNQLDILVNNAGTAFFEAGLEETLSLEIFDTTFAVNVRAPLQLTHLLTPYLIASKGTVVNNSSVYGIRTPPIRALSYGLSKAALNHMTRCIAEELAPQGVRVNAVNPGVIPTQIAARAGLSDEQVQEWLEFHKKTHAMRRTGTVEEVAKLVAFLASSDSSFTTGETVLTDGGNHLLVTALD
ncbi:dehydrogenase/reductase SDR family member 4-like [Lytechinus variegatus]|uniref:dehydrogenase/reductase SDR family member 4-like n=1 Tax=Lytechinus variegatus TaxID=7654 RepID=UPI001BB1D0C5|nr:dehydrogenase/reductase SDR family member 4-like [Lytechinus variegatus]